ncbi:hypothetical protein E4H12_09110 [Candidatus Thorarchaeota archaeon]|nr:MAG: hypothetical protein E4H12_09110 [Candidatus Thorarchaeota archaeon]
MKEVELTTIILDFVHSETGWGDPLRPYCEFEDLYLDEIERQPDNKVKVLFRYLFDEDGFSQYDKSHSLEGMVVLDSSGSILESTLKEIFTGVAANREPYRPQSA